MSLIGTDDQVPIEILQDTGAYNSYIFESVLPLSEKTNTEDVILSCRVG